MPSKKWGVVEHSISSSTLLVSSESSVCLLCYPDPRVWRCHLDPLERPAVGELFEEGKPRPWLELFGGHGESK